MDMKRRPPGITNEEFKKLNELIGDIFGKYQSLGYRRLSSRRGGYETQYSHSCVPFTKMLRDVSRVLRRYFLEIPRRENSHIDENYTKVISENTGKNVRKMGKVSCEVCGETRCLDRAHIIPQSVLNNIYWKDKELWEESDNHFILCPTHHRLFDKGQLLKSEWNKLKINNKNPHIIGFVQEVLLPRQEKFWKEATKAIISNGFWRAPSKKLIDAWKEKYRIE